MVILDRIRLTGLLPKSPANAGVFYSRGLSAEREVGGQGHRDEAARDDRLGENVWPITPCVRSLRKPLLGASRRSPLDSDH